jgi:hypothetical protein
LTEEVTMTEVSSTIESVPKHVPWNKGKIGGAKPPLRPNHVWSIRMKLQVAEGRSKFRGAMPTAAKLVEPALDEVYATLSSGPKARLNAPQQAASP